MKTWHHYDNNTHHTTTSLYFLIIKLYSSFLICTKPNSMLTAKYMISYQKHLLRLTRQPRHFHTFLIALQRITGNVNHINTYYALVPSLTDVWMKTIC